MRADALANGGSRGEWTGHGRFRLSDAADRQGAESRESTAGKAGPAQEGAAVETVALPGQAGRDRSA
jgi:hypothetical protein